MNVSETTSSQGEWLRFYQRKLSSQPADGGSGGGGGGGSGGGIMFGRTSPLTESTVVTTSATSASSPAVAGSDRVQPASEGRVGKAARRRSRASRKAPTTILNTDTTNFRAMVQQFTGVPSMPFPAGYPHMAGGVGAGGQATLSFDIAGAAAQFHQQPANFPFGIQQQQQQQQQQYQQFQQHHERPPFMLGETGGSTGSSSSNAYLRGFGGSNPQSDSMVAPDGLLLERLSSSQMMPRPAASTGSSTTDRFLLR